MSSIALEAIAFKATGSDSARSACDTPQPVIVVHRADDVEAVRDALPDVDVTTFVEAADASLDADHLIHDRDVIALLRDGVASEQKAALKLRDQLADTVDYFRVLVLPNWARGRPLQSWMDARVTGIAAPPALMAWINGRADEPQQQEPPQVRNGQGKAKKRARTAGDGKFNLTDFGLAERLTFHNGADLRHVHPWSKWLIWDGKRWAIDSTGRIGRLAKSVVRRIYAEAADTEDDDQRAAIAAFAEASESRRSVDAMIALARCDLPAEVEELDRDPWLLNCQNGTINLRSGALRPHNREDLITKLCPVAFDPDANCPVWEATLWTIFDGNAKLIAYWQRLCGLALTGDVTEQQLPILFGTGSNGKSTILNVLLDMLGPDFAMKATADLLMAKRIDGHPTQQSDLHGKRLVVAIESGEGARLNEVLIKELTGSDKIRTRRMREDFWEFSPTHKIMLCTNHRPEVRGTDHAIWRRLRLIPFSVTIPDNRQDRQLPDKLAAELPGILAWCVRGCLAWQETGLNPPDEVAEATREYRAEQDVLAAFLEEECVLFGQAKVRANQLYDRYQKWAERSGEHKVPSRRFGIAMTERGFSRYKNSAIWYSGIGLRQDDRDETDEIADRI